MNTHIQNVLKFNKLKKVWASYGFICSCCGEVWNIGDIHTCDKYNELVKQAEQVNQ